MNIKNIKISSFIYLIIVLFLIVDFVGYNIIVNNIKNNYAKDTQILFYKIKSQTNDLLSQLLYEYSLQKDILITKHTIVNTYLENKEDIFNLDLSEIKRNINDNDNQSSYNIYISNKDLIIKNTTYNADKGFDLSFAKDIFDNHYKNNIVGVCSPLFERTSKSFVSYTDAYVLKNNKKRALLQISYNYPNTKRNIQDLKKLLKQYSNILDLQAYIVSDSGVVKNIILKDYKPLKTSKKDFSKNLLIISEIQSKLKNNTIYKQSFTQNNKNFQQIYLSTQNAIFKNTKIIYSIVFDDSKYYEELFLLKIYIAIITFIALIAIFILGKLRAKEKEQNFKEKRFLEQSKLASMGEIIGNIAHQWRQPLSIIGAASSSMELQKKLGILDDDIFYKSCNTINKNLKYLSQTIDDFRDFIKGERIKQEFKLQDMIDSFLVLNDSIIINHNINIVLHIEEDLIINSYKNELIQCLLNIFNNSVYAFSKNNIKEKYIFITIKKDSNNILISIKDNARGIDNNIINKIFEPYFTTKHKSKGTGLGLHMTYKLITEGMDGDIKVKNETYTYKNKNYTGACFTLTLNSE